MDAGTLRIAGAPPLPSGDSFDSVSLDEVGPNRIIKAWGAGLLGGDQSIVLFCEA
jgi:hypothetical protein